MSRQYPLRQSCAERQSKRMYRRVPFRTPRAWPMPYFGYRGSKLSLSLFQKTAGVSIAAMRELKVTPHVAQNNTNRRSAIDQRTRHDGYAVSQRKRKRVEE